MSSLLVDPQELGFIQAAVGSVLGQQFLVRALFGNPLFSDDDDPIGMLDGRQTVRDDEWRTALRPVIQRFLDDSPGLGIQRGRRFIQNQDPRIFLEHARNLKPLLLPAG